MYIQAVCITFVPCTVIYVGLYIWIFARNKLITIIHYITYNAR